MSGQRGVLALQSDGITFGSQQQVAVSATGTVNKAPARNAQSLPKFQQAFGKNICTLSPNELPAQASSSSSPVEQTLETPVQQQPQAQRIIKTGTNAIKTVQATTANVQLAQGTRQILNLVQTSSVAAGGSSSAAGQTLLCSPSTPGVFYRKIPVTLAGSGQPGSSLVALGPNNTRTLKLNIIRQTPFRGAAATAPAAIQAVLASKLQPQVAASAAALQRQAVSQQQPQTPIPIERPIPTESYTSETLEQLREFEDVLAHIQEKGTSPNSSTQGISTTDDSTQTQAVVAVQSNQRQVVTLNQQLANKTQRPITTTATVVSSTGFSSTNSNNVTFLRQSEVI